MTTITDWPNDAIFLVFDRLPLRDIKNCKVNKEMKAVVDEYIWQRGKCVIRLTERLIGLSFTSTRVWSYISRFQYFRIVLEVDDYTELLLLMKRSQPILDVASSHKTSILVIINYTANSFNGIKDCIENINRVYCNIQTHISLKAS